MIFLLAISSGSIFDSNRAFQYQHFMSDCIQNHASSMEELSKNQMMEGIRMRKGCIAAFFLLFSAGLAWAQSQATTGVIQGQVTDEAGSPLPGAVVVILNTATNFEISLVTDAEGRFRGLLLPLGPYRVRASLDGFATVVRDGLQLTVGRTIDLDLVLKPSSVSEEIVVKAESPLVETSKTESSTQIDEISIEGLPNNGRNFLDFLTLTPSVSIVQGPDGDEITINGQKGINNNIALDGADFNNPFFGEQRGGQRPAFTFNLDAVQEVVVVSEGAPAEYGRSSGGFINVITKSGTNDYSGTAHLFYKEDNLNSKAENPDGTKADRFDFEQQQIGFTAGGPIIKDKVFYFATADFQRGRSTKQTNPDRIEPRLVEYFESIGIPNENGPIERTDDAWALSLKLDFNLNPNHQLTLRLNATDSEQKNGTFDVDSWGVSANADELDDSWSISGALNSYLSDSFINELRFQYGRENRPRPYNGPLIAGQNRPLPDTAFDFVNSYRFGMPFFIPVSYHDTRAQINNNLSIVKGSHLIKAGIEVNLTRAAQTFVGFANGRYIFGSTDGFLNFARNPNYVECSDGSTSETGTCPEGTDPVGPVLFYLQQVGVGNLTAADAGTQTLETFEPAIFIQDQWEPRDNLVVQYGLRWEAQDNPEVITPPEDVFFADFIGQVSNGQLFPSNGTIPDDYNMWQPRFAVAWDPEGEGKSVMRASAGVYYSRVPGLNFASTRSTNGSRGQSLFRSSAAAPFLGPVPAYPDLIPQSEVGDPVNPDVFVTSASFQNPRTTTASFSYERQLSPDLRGSIKYVYAKGENQTRFINRNDALLGSPWSSGLGPDGGNGIGNLTSMESTGESLYRGYTVSMSKRMSRGFQFQANYTYSKDKSHDDNERDPFTYRYARVTDLDAEWGLSDRDQRHRANAWIHWDAPYGIQVNTRYSYRSAQPKSITETGEDANAPSDRINADGTITRRNLGRKDNQFSSIDLRISRNFKWGNASFEPVLEIFNLANSKNLLRPAVTNLIFNFDGTVQSGAGSPRQIQLGLKGRW